MLVTKKKYTKLRAAHLGLNDFLKNSHFSPTNKATLGVKFIFMVLKSRSLLIKNSRDF